MSATAASIELPAFDFNTQASPDADRVRQALIGTGLETPLIETGLTRDEKYDRIKASLTGVGDRTRSKFFA